jgi:hypothetical protein
MGTLLFDFVVQQHGRDHPYPFNHKGPLFHRWLPDGEKDAIVLNTEDAQAELKVSFERRGYINDSGHVVFKWDRHEVNPEVIPRQAVLEGGHLVGWLKIEGMADEELIHLQKAEMGDPAYESLGKRIIKLIHPPVNKMLNLLGTNYGQYWVEEIKEWDSRKRSLGSYCAGLGIRWSFDDGNSWFEFVPNERKSTHSRTIAVASDDAYRRELLTEEDWLEIPEVANGSYEPSPAAFILTRAYQLLDQGHLRQAFIEGVTALEVALDDYIRQRRGNSKTLVGLIEQFEGLSLSVKVAAVAVISGSISASDVDDTIAAYKVRNLIVHDGKHPSEGDKHKLSALLNTAGSLIPGPKFRFLRTHRQNSLDAQEKS